MQTYNQFNQGRSIMPLLMNFTTPSPIQTRELEMPSVNYNDKTQISYEMRLACTRCVKLKTKTGPGGRSVNCDYKNENDDTKNVR